MADPTLTIRIAGDLTAIKTALTTLQGDVSKLGGRLATSTDQGTKSLGRMERAVTQARQAVIGLATSFAAIQAARVTIGLGDEFARITGVLKLATNSTDEFARAQAGVFEIAQKTRAPLSDTAATYGALQRTTKAAGLSQGELLRTLETVNKAIALTPVSAQAAQAALTQFSQALGGDFKAGAQELNSILEQTPGLAITIAQGLGVETSALKKLGEEGKLSTELVVRGLLRVGDQVDEKFKQVPKTVSGAFTTIKNQLLVSLGSADLSPLTGALEELRKTLADPAVINNLVRLGGVVATFAGQMVRAAAATAGFVGWVGDELASALSGPAADDLVRLDARVSNLQASLDRVRNAGPISSLFVFGGKDARVAELTKQLNEAKAAYDAASLAAEQAATAAGKAAKARADEADKIAADAQRKFDEAQAKAAGKSGGIAIAQRDSALLKDSTDRALRELDRLYADGKVKLQDYFLEKRRLEVAAITAEVDAARLEAAGATTLEERTKALTKVTLLERQRNDIIKQSAIERAAAEKELAQELENVQDRLAAANGDNLAGRVREIERERATLLKKFAQDPGAATFIEKLFDVEVARARAKQISDEADKLIREIEQKETSVSTQVSAGVISQAIGEQQLHAARDRTIEQLAKLKLALEALPPSQETLDAIGSLDASILELSQRNLSGLGKTIADLRQELAKIQADFAGNAIKGLQDGLTDFFVSIFDGSKSAGEALKDFVRGFAQAMLQIAARALATFLVLQTLDAIYPGLGKATAAAIGAGSHHTGGIAGSPRTTRMVSPLLFAAAPRYHSGGMAGLKPDEVPAILQKGEEILPKTDPRHRNNGGNAGGEAGGNLRVVNVFDASFVPDQINGPEGERVFMNFIGKNPGRVKQLLGIV